MNDLAKFEIPAEFVVEHISYLTPEEVRYGYETGWLSPEAAVKVALVGSGRLPARCEPYEELGLLLSDEFHRITGLIEELPSGECAEAKSTWLYLALAWIYSHRGEYEDRTVIAGQSLGGLAPAYAGLHASHRFGRVLSQSGAFWWPGGTEGEVDAKQLISQYKELPNVDVTFFQEAGSLERELLETNQTCAMSCGKRDMS